MTFPNGGTRDNEYTYEGGEFLFHMAGEIVSKNKTVSILFNKPTGTVYSHGDPLKIKSKFDAAYLKYINNGLEDEATDIAIIDITDFRMLDDLNKCINVAGYIHNMVSTSQVKRSS